MSCNKHCYFRYLKGWNKLDSCLNSISFQIETGANNGFQFKTHPNINKELFSNENLLGLKDPSRPFPAGPTGDALGVGLLKWRMQSADEALVPLSSKNAKCNVISK